MVGCSTCSQGGSYFSFGRVHKKKLPKRKMTKRKSPKRKPTKRMSPKRKVVKDKRGRKIGTRLSARTVYNEKGRKALGKSFRILQKDGKYKMKVLRLRRDGVPYFSSKFGRVETVIPKPVSFNKHLQHNKVYHLNIPYNNHWLRGSASNDMTGILNSWPNKGMYIAPGGVAQPLRTSMLPKFASGTRRGNNFGTHHTHFGKTCFGA